MNEKKGKVFVGMSGGVDSSVSAALLKEQGYDVVGVFIKVWQADFLPCSWREERREAMRAAAHLQIPFLTLDLEREYKQEVVDYMIREYSLGRVPNPDVMCNKHVKFGGFLDFAKAHGADFIATGHYARTAVGSDGSHTLLAGVDREKDQSYFLWTLTQDQLAHTLFPVGDLEKSEVRELARKFGLPNAEKKDSQGLCFMGAVDMSDFLKHYIKAESGAVLDAEGAVIGEHDGAMLYTIGQRHGFRTTKRSPNEAPYVVVSKDLAANTVTVAHQDALPTNETSRVIKVIGLHLHAPDAPLHLSEPLTARIRYRGELLSCTIMMHEDGTESVVFEQAPSGIAGGQSIVFYRDGACLGGAVIDA